MSTYVFYTSQGWFIDWIDGAGSWETPLYPSEQFKIWGAAYFLKFLFDVLGPLLTIGSETRQSKTFIAGEFLYHLNYEYWRPNTCQALLSVMQMKKRCLKGAWMMLRESPLNVMFLLEVQWIKGEVGWNEWESRNIGISWKNSWVRDVWADTFMRCGSEESTFLWERCPMGREGKSVQSGREHLLALKTSSKKAPRLSEAVWQRLVLLETHWPLENRM